MTDHATLRTLAEAATPGRHEVPYVDANRRDVLTEHDLFRGEPTDALVARARQHIADLCTKRASWRMAVPPSNHDSDMLLGEALTRLSDELETLRAALPAEPWVASDDGERWCYACDHEDTSAGPAGPVHSPDCAWLKALAGSGR